MKWKDTWIHEGLMPAYQNLVDDFWADHKQPVKPVENIKSSDQDHEDVSFLSLFKLVLIAV